MVKSIVHGLLVFHSVTCNLVFTLS